MPKTIAEERIKLVALTVAPANPAAPTIAELTATGAVDLSCKVLFSDFRLSPTASDTVSEPALCEGGNSSVPGKSNYEGSLTLFRFLDEDGKPVVTEDAGWDLLKTKGADLWLYKRIGPRFDEPYTAGQEIEGYHVLTDLPQDPTDFSGYIKKTIPLFVQGDSVVDAVVGPAA
jgi:hypothetical protein